MGDYVEKKQQIDGEVAEKQDELNQLQEKINDLTIKVEKEHQKFLMYRCYDISDMIKVLRPFCLGEYEESAKLNVSSLLSNNLNAKDAKTKKHALELELIKMQQELLELELKRERQRLVHEENQRRIELTDTVSMR